ncbi:transposable element Tcb1 transposase [Trichonephila clavipes]|uniref:Transposable element Tcb1 transposase n=1 Tax=Trichonephila clavipes TaxID=2585209 RepID=A0A8X6S668_TRICX|nr:transposable element Tcb1 transposase [Trichonephila clavipes]
MVWGAIGYTSRSPLVRIEDTLNITRYVSGVLRPVALPFIRVLRNPMFKQDNARPHVAGIVRIYLDTEGVQLLSSDWLVNIRCSIQLMSCGIVLKLHGHLYLYMPSNFCLTQSQAYKCCHYCQRWLFLVLISQNLCTQIF